MCWTYIASEDIELPGCTEDIGSLHPVPWYDCINLCRNFLVQDFAVPLTP